MSRIIDKVQGTPILKNLMVLVSGSVLAQLIGVLAAPLLSRLYTPEDFGVIGSIMAVVGVVSVITSLKYEMALVLEKDDAKAQALQVLCWRLLLAITALSALVILTTPWWLHWFTEDEALLKFLPWSVPIIFLTGLFKIYNFRLNRERKYKALSSALVARRLSLVVTQVIFGFCGAQALGLILGNLAGCVMAVIVLLISNRAILSFKSSNEVGIKEVARDHYRFAAYSAPQNLLSAISTNLPVFALGYFYGVGAVGAYWFSMRLLMLPAALIGQALRQIFYKEAAELKTDILKLKGLYRKFTLGLSLVISIPVVIVFTFGAELFVAVFGEQWLLAGQFTEWMVLWIGAAFLNPPAMALFNVFNAQKQLLLYDLLLMFFRIVTLIGLPVMGIEVVGTMAIYSIISVMFYVVVIVYWFRKLNYMLK